MQNEGDGLKLEIIKPKGKEGVNRYVHGYGNEKVRYEYERAIHQSTGIKKLANAQPMFS